MNAIMALLFQDRILVGAAYIHRPSVGVCREWARLMYRRSNTVVEQAPMNRKASSIVYHRATSKLFGADRFLNLCGSIFPLGVTYGDR